MDELTLEGKKYLSSKRAAKITGYAKDYVGQMCREGSVNARLVGRSWYVLEDSIREHRFGKEKNSSNAEVLITGNTKEPQEEQKKSKIRYTAETTVPIQTAVPKRSFLSSEIQYIQKEDQAIQHEMHGVSSMQDTWREWFSTTPAQEEKLATNVSISIEKERLSTGKTNDFNDNQANENENTSHEHVTKNSKEYGEDSVMHNGEWKEVINYAPLSEEEASQPTQVINSDSNYTTIQKQQDVSSIDLSSNNNSLSRRSYNRSINALFILIAIIIGSFSVINLLSANQSYGNTGTFWSGINHVGGVRAFVNKK